MSKDFDFDIFMLCAEKSRRKEERMQEALRNLTDEQLEQRIAEAEKKLKARKENDRD